MFTSDATAHELHKGFIWCVLVWTAARRRRMQSAQTNATVREACLCSSGAHTPTHTHAWPIIGRGVSGQTTVRRPIGDASTCGLSPPAWTQSPAHRLVNRVLLQATCCSGYQHTPPLTQEKAVDTISPPTAASCCSSCFSKICI